MLSFYEWYHDLPHVMPMMWGDQTDVHESADWYQSVYWVVIGSNLPMTRRVTILNYSEGLHRLTDPAEVDVVSRTLHAATLLFAVEPADVDALPRWVNALQPSFVVLYEAHRPWREAFGLPYVNLDEFAVHLADQCPNTTVRALTCPGQAVVIDA